MLYLIIRFVSNSTSDTSVISENTFKDKAVSLLFKDVKEVNMTYHYMSAQKKPNKKNPHREHSGVSPTT